MTKKYDFDEGEIFEDGLDEDLMGDEDDRAWLSTLSEKDREQELFKRAEQREVTQMRMEVQQKLKHSTKRQISPPKTQIHTPKRPHIPALKMGGVFSSDSGPNDTPQLSLPLLNAARVPRSLFEKLIHYSYFRDSLAGMFIRINSGYDEEDNIVYKIGEIKHVVEIPPYKLGPTKTGRAVMVLVEGREKLVRFEFVSNGEFTERELKAWRGVAEVEGVEEKGKELRRIERRRATEMDVELMITEKMRFSGNEGSAAWKKCGLLKKMEEAGDDGDWERVEIIKRELAEIESSRVVEDDPILRINERNRARDRSDVGGETRKEILSDPFTRRQCRPSIVSMVTRVEKESKEEVREEVREEEKAVSLFEAHDFEIDLDLSRIGEGKLGEDKRK